MTDADTATTGRSRLKTVAQVIGVIGLVACLALLVGILYARSLIDTRVDETFSNVDGVIDRGTVVVNLASGRLQERLADIDSFVEDAKSAAQGVQLPPALADRAASIVERYGDIRDEYIAVRERIGSALQTLEQVARFLPIDLPTGPRDALTALDERVQAFDTAVSGLRTEAGATVARAAAAATAMRAAVDGIAGVTTRIETAMGELRVRVDRANDTIDGYLWTFTIILLVLVAYLALLNVLVIVLARR